jgi:hypothetical protein
MLKSKICVVLAVVVCLALSGTASAKRLNPGKTPAPKKGATEGKDNVTLAIAGPADSQSTAAYQKALEASGLTAKVREGKKGDKGLHVMAAIDKSTDLGPYGKAVMAAVPTKPGQMPPALELMVYAPLTKETSAQAIAQLEKVKGVDAKHSTTDVKKGALHVRISGAEHVTTEDILKAIESAGVAPKLAKDGHLKKTT